MYASGYSLSGVWLSPSKERQPLSLIQQQNTPLSGEYATVDGVSRSDGCGALLSQLSQEYVI
ncbi:MAG: hypothetical protein KC587_19050, partial [Nitrospira sp.]|nr:hypothetical protein [Nitrospira sp.]